MLNCTEKPNLVGASKKGSCSFARSENLHFELKMRLFAYSAIMKGRYWLNILMII